jgi:hypothetical protein
MDRPATVWRPPTWSHLTRSSFVRRTFSASLACSSAVSSGRGLAASVRSWHWPGPSPITVLTSRHAPTPRQQRSRGVAQHQGPVDRSARIWLPLRPGADRPLRALAALAYGNARCASRTSQPGHLAPRAAESNRALALKALKQRGRSWLQYPLSVCAPEGQVSNLLSNE